MGDTADGTLSPATPGGGIKSKRFWLLCHPKAEELLRRHGKSKVLSNTAVLPERLRVYAAFVESLTIRALTAADVRDPDLKQQHLAARALRMLNRIRRVELTANHHQITLTTRRTPSTPSDVPPTASPTLITTPPEHSS